LELTVLIYDLQFCKGKINRCRKILWIK